MLHQDKAQIYLSKQRGETTSEGFRSLHTFNCNGYCSDGREPVGRLLAFNFNVLKATQSIDIKINKTLEIVYIPIEGGLEILTEENETVFVSPGESFRYTAMAESSVRVINPYSVERIQYIQLHFEPGQSSLAILNSDRQAPLFSLSVQDKNKFHPAFTSSDKSILACIGQYDARNEGVVSISLPEKIVFTYIIRGAFEVQNRLLETGDALTLWQVEKLEFEALLDEGIILIIQQ